MAHKARLLRHKISRAVVAIQMGVGEIAAPAAGDTDFLADFAGVIHQAHPQAGLACLCGAHHAGGTGAQHQYIIGGQGGHAAVFR